MKVTKVTFSDNNKSANTASHAELSDISAHRIVWNRYPKARILPASPRGWRIVTDPQKKPWRSFPIAETYHGAWIEAANMLLRREEPVVEMGSNFLKTKIA